MNFFKEMRIKKLIEGFERDINSNSVRLVAPNRSKAKEVSTYGELAIEPLSKVLHISTDAHYALGIIGGERAFQLLIKELKTNNDKRIKASASALGGIGDMRAIEYIQSSSIGNSGFAGRVIIQIKEKNNVSINDEEIDRTNPLGQLKGKWSEYDGLRIKLGISGGYRYKQQQKDFISWLRKLKNQMTELKFTSTEDKLHAWRMLGIMLYYLENPDATSFYKECEDAAYCFEQYLTIKPDENDIKDMLDRIKK